MINFYTLQCLYFQPYHIITPYNDFIVAPDHCFPKCDWNWSLALTCFLLLELLSLITSLHIIMFVLLPLITSLHIIMCELLPLITALWNAGQLSPAIVLFCSLYWHWLVLSLLLPQNKKISISLTKNYECKLHLSPNAYPKAEKKPRHKGKYDGDMQPNKEG